MARTVGDTQLPTNVPPVNAPNGRRLSVTLPRCAAAFPTGRPTWWRLSVYEASSIRVTAWTFSATNVRCHAPDAQLPSPSLPHAFQG
jgi:hypothetical protein